MVATSIIIIVIGIQGIIVCTEEIHAAAQRDLDIVALRRNVMNPVGCDATDAELTRVDFHTWHVMYGDLPVRLTGKTGFMLMTFRRLLNTIKDYFVALTFACELHTAQVADSAAIACDYGLLKSLAAAKGNKLTSVFANITAAFDHLADLLKTPPPPAPWEDPRTKQEGTQNIVLPPQMPSWLKKLPAHVRPGPSLEPQCRREGHCRFPRGKNSEFPRGKNS